MLARFTWDCNIATLRKMNYQLTQPVALPANWGRRQTGTRSQLLEQEYHYLYISCPAGTRTRVVMGEVNIRSISSLADEQGVIMIVLCSIPAQCNANKEMAPEVLNRQTWCKEAISSAGGG